MMVVADEGVLFAGDLVFSARLPFIADGDSRAWLAALDRLAGMAPSIVIPGHGPASREAVADLTLTRDYLRFVHTAMA